MNIRSFLAARSTSGSPPKKDRGGALLMAIFSLLCVVSIAVGVLRIAGATTRRQTNAVDDKRAFYLAEAALSESYFALRTGRGGQIGAADAPALIAEGLAWVDVSVRDDGMYELRSTGLCDAGRATVEIVVERTEQPLGMFAEERVDLTGGVLVDGFDSSKGDYADTLRPGKVDTTDPDPTMYVDSANSLLFYKGIFYRYSAVDGTNYTYDAAFDFRANLDMGFDADDFFDGDDWGDDEYTIVVDHFATLPALDGEPVDAGDFGLTSGSGGLLGTNGNLVLGDGAYVFGDLVTGPTGSVTLAPGAEVSGETVTRHDDLVLPAVQVPTVTWLPGFTHTSSIPKVLVPGVVGYETITVASGSELVIPADADVVVRDLVLQDGAQLTIQNASGPSNLYVTGTANFAGGSRIDVEGRSAADLSLQVEGTGTLDLASASQFYGMVYAPDATVTIGADFELFGFVAAENLTLAPNARLHFDKSVLEGAGSVPMPRLVAWTIEEVPTEVRQSRIDPLVLLDLQENELESLTDATRTISWTLFVDHYVGMELVSSYEGPVQFWAPPAGTTTSKFTGLLPPEDDPGGSWYAHVRYETPDGSEFQVDTPIEDVIGTGGSPPLVSKVLLWEITHLPN